jgi:hypothetical protein
MNYGRRKPEGNCIAVGENNPAVLRNVNANSTGDAIKWLQRFSPRTPMQGRTAADCVTSRRKGLAALSHNAAW